MNHPHLDLLLLTDEELQEAKRHVQEIAYFKWQEAGCPQGQEQKFWDQAELEWIEFYYVPDRN